MDIVKGDTSPWGTTNCVALLGTITSPTAENAAKWTKELLEPSDCGKDLVAMNTKYGCCVASIAAYNPVNPAQVDANGKLVKDTFIPSMFTNAGATVKEECDLMSSKGQATLEFQGVSQAWLESKTVALKTDLKASAGLTDASLGAVVIESKTTRRRLGDSRSADMRAMEAEMTRLNVPAEMREHRRRLAETVTTAKITYGGQEAEDINAVTARLTAVGGFEPDLLKKEAELDGENIAVSAVAAQNIAPEKKTSRLGTWADWMHQDCPTAEEDGNPWWCATVVLVGSGTFIVLTVGAAVGITILIVVKKKRDAATVAEFEKPNVVVGVVSGVEMTSNPDASTAARKGVEEVI